MQIQRPGRGVCSNTCAAFALQGLEGHAVAAQHLLLLRIAEGSWLVDHQLGAQSAEVGEGVLRLLGGWLVEAYGFQRW